MNAEHGKAHPKESTYVKVALWLALITAIEIVISYTHWGYGAKVLTLVGLSVVKFGAVVAYFMHLKFDNPLLRKPFITGVILAGSIYTIVLFSLIGHKA